MRKKRNIFLKIQIVLFIALAPIALVFAISLTNPIDINKTNTHIIKQESLIIIDQAFAEINQQTGPIIIDHTCTDINLVPNYWINKAKSEFRIAYGHTSHGSQIVSGMKVLMAQSDLYSFNHNGTNAALSLHDYDPSGDLGNPDRTTWAQRTRDLLDTPGCDRNMIMWSWCGQANTSEENIDLYLSLMNQLEEDYPNVTFVYMTGHLNGTGEEGNLNIRNNQIREFCKQNNKTLFDFADIESYDPDGNYFLDKNADDGCNYDSDGNGSLDANWADEWCAAHPGECPSCSCAHSKPLNCYMKGKAFWWMMARLAGWNLGDCDYNDDDVVDKKDLIDKREDVFQEYENWIRDCWTPMEECADFNGDGVIDTNDMLDKQKSVTQELIAWMLICGFYKKGRPKR